MEPALISKALSRVRILGKNKPKSSLVNLITGDSFCSAAAVKCQTNAQWIYNKYGILLNNYYYINNIII